MDISAIGVRFSHDMTREYKVGQQMKMYLGHEQAFYELKGRVMRKELASSQKCDKIEYVALQFFDINCRIEEELHRIVRKIERQKPSNVLYRN